MLAINPWQSDPRTIANRGQGRSYKTHPTRAACSTDLQIDE